MYAGAMLSGDFAQAETNKAKIAMPNGVDFTNSPNLYDLSTLMSDSRSVAMLLLK